MKKLLVMGAILALGVVFVEFSVKVDAQKGASALFSFRETPAARPSAEKSSLASVKEADISIDLQQLSRGTTPRLRIPLFDGKTYQAVNTSTEMRDLTDLTWRGKIREGKFDGDVVLTFKNGYVAGIIYAPIGGLRDRTERRPADTGSNSIRGFSPTARAQSTANLQKP